MKVPEKPKIISVQNLSKSYGNLKAVDDISFDVYKEEIFGMVGPNGAGKTTTVESIEGLRRPSNGKISVFDLNPINDRYSLKYKIGMQIQDAFLPDRIKVGEALNLFSAIYGKQLDIQNLLDQFGLSGKSGYFFGKLSGGEKQRLFIALSLIHDPDIVFMDELTTGLDPQARRAMWELVLDIRKKGKTIFLTTHYMEEAEKLCDRVAILDKGKIIALDTPDNLIQSLGIDNRVVFKVEGDFKDIEEIKKLKSVSEIKKNESEYSVYGRGEGLLVEVVNYLATKKYKIIELKNEKSNLEDVYISLTGKKIRD